MIFDINSNLKQGKNALQIQFLLELQYDGYSASRRPSWGTEYMVKMNIIYWTKVLQEDANNKGWDHRAQECKRTNGSKICKEMSLQVCPKC